MDIKTIRILSSIPMNSVNEQNYPERFGSGCFVKYKDSFFFLTVFHTIENNKLSPKIVSDIDPDRGALLLNLDLSFSIRGDLHTGLEDEFIDYAWQHFQKMPECYYIQNDDKGNIQRIQRMFRQTDFSIVPNKDEEYGFAGFVNFRLEDNPYVKAPIKKILNQDFKEYSGLKFIGSDGDYHYFHCLILMNYMIKLILKEPVEHQS